ncbi:Thiamine-phosphate synthase [Pannonibacter phragmitetus]|uniref:Thiamine-phosphate synthase n=1 Tax=Pannonibacter phragmitetus TaxID=121719 RepID=A0A378ZPM5_9HYPH|nr:thiamine phosphate synthase [Pannonibacter phragmitetus]SUA99206.1 Thiamine-phosphate synthase [Pannonibacter phragmitetus]
MTLDPFYLIVDSADWIARLVPQGVKLVQLRVKGCEPEELRRQIREAKAVCEAHGATLVLNDYWQMAIDEGCSWLHLGQEDLAEADLAAIRRAGLKLGLSTHDEAELETALAAKPDYVALGPVYPTILKEMKWVPQGLERLGIWKSRIGALPLIGIGGLTPERAEAALAAGADSAAVATDITRNTDPEARVREWLAATARWR